MSHDLESLTAPIRPGGEPPIWGTFYDIRRYGGLQIVLRALTCGGSLVLSSAGEPVADEATLRDALSAMTARRADRLPVADREGRPVGVITLADLVR